MDKSRLRRPALIKRRALSSAFRAHAAELILEKLLSDKRWKTSIRVGCYLAMPEEVPTQLILEQAWQVGKQVAVPVVSPDRRQMHFQQLDSLDQLAPGPLGILQPRVPASKVRFGRQDLLLIPGVAFDTHGNRIGMGKGFYDRYLPDCLAHRCGIAFDIQLVSQLPSAPYDIPVDMLVTEKRIMHSLHPSYQHHPGELPA